MAHCSIARRTAASGSYPCTRTRGGATSARVDTSGTRGFRSTGAVPVTAVPMNQSITRDRPWQRAAGSLPWGQSTYREPRSVASPLLAQVPPEGLRTSITRSMPIRRISSASVAGSMSPGTPIVKTTGLLRISLGGAAMVGIGEVMGSMFRTDAIPRRAPVGGGVPSSPSPAGRMRSGSSPVRSRLPPSPSPPRAGVTPRRSPRACAPPGPRSRGRCGSVGCRPPPDRRRRRPRCRRAGSRSCRR